MSGYNSGNTYVLETHVQAGGNTRMLLLHRRVSGGYEYIIGSYFHEETVCDPHGPAAFPIEYSWDWGHYFNGDGALLRAVDYWKREVLGEGSEE